MIAALVLSFFFYAPETTQVSSSRRSAVTATLQRMCNAGLLHLMGLKGLGNFAAATVQR